MAKTETALSIVLRTVDKATATLNAVSKKIDEVTKPTRDFGKALKELGEKSGFNHVIEGFKGVGEGAKETFLKILEGAAIIGETTHLLLEMVEAFASLNDTAERIGVEVDFLTGMRYAASKSGASIEQLDAGLTTFATNLGGVKTGTGKLVKFLGEVAPTMLTQLKATRTTEEALGILADGMEKLTNKSKLLKFAQEALGDPALAAVFHRGPKGIMELMTAYAKLAGSQKEAAERAAKVDDALKDLHAATDGVKAALVTGLSPALTIIIDKLTAWLSGHREDVEKWAEDIGKKLPDAVDMIVVKVREAYEATTKFIDKIGGLKTVAVLVAAAIAGPLVLSLISLASTLTLTVLPAIAAMTVALLASPAGPFIAAVVLMSATLAVFSNQVSDAQKKTEFFFDSWGFIQFRKFQTVGDLLQKQIDDMNKATANTDFLHTMTPTPLAPFSPPAPDAPKLSSFAAARTLDAASLSAAPGAGATTPQTTETRIKVDFMNAPKGMRATAEPSRGVYVDTNVGYQMGFGI